MKKWNSSGRFGLTRGLLKRLWSSYYSLAVATGSEGKSQFLESGVNPNQGFQGNTPTPTPTPPCVYGCTDSSATNYDPNATCDDGSCIPCVYGCTDSSATNYDPNATCDDGSCCYDDYSNISFLSCDSCGQANFAINDSCGNYLRDELMSLSYCDTYGCTDPSALNYNAEALCDDGSCCYKYGCTDNTASNYDPTADCDDGSCIPCVYGCTDNTASNYDPTADCDDGSCIPCVYGCMSTGYCNYNPSATCEDYSCQDTYEVDNGCVSCGEKNYSLMCVDVVVDSYNVDARGGCDDYLGCDENFSFYGCEGSSEVQARYYGCGPVCEYRTVYEPCGQCSSEIGGCTNPSASNYDPSVICDDGSCIFGNSILYNIINLSYIDDIGSYLYNIKY